MIHEAYQFITNAQKKTEVTDMEEVDWTASDMLSVALPQQCYVLFCFKYNF